MKIKKIVALVLALALMCALAACGGGSGSETDSNRTDNANSGSETVYTVTIGHAAAEDLAQHQCALAIKEYLEEIHWHWPSAVVPGERQRGGGLSGPGTASKNYAPDHHRP